MTEIIESSLEGLDVSNNIKEMLVCHANIKLNEKLREMAVSLFELELNLLSDFGMLQT